MEAGTRIYVPVSIAGSRISRRFDTIPSGTLNPNADEIKYMQRLVQYKRNVSIHNSMIALAAAALSNGNEEGPKLVHRLDRESSGLVLMGRTKKRLLFFNKYSVTLIN